MEAPEGARGERCKAVAGPRGQATDGSGKCAASARGGTEGREKMREGGFDRWAVRKDGRRTLSSPSSAPTRTRAPTSHGAQRPGWRSWNAGGRASALSGPQMARRNAGAQGEAHAAGQAKTRKSPAPGGRGRQAGPSLRPGHISPALRTPSCGARLSRRHGVVTRAGGPCGPWPALPFERPKKGGRPLWVSPRGGHEKRSPPPILQRSVSPQRPLTTAWGISSRVRPRRDSSEFDRRVRCW